MSENSIALLLKTIVAFTYRFTSLHRHCLPACLLFILIYRDFQTIYTDVLFFRLLFNAFSSLDNVFGFGCGFKTICFYLSVYRSSLCVCVRVRVYTCVYLNRARSKKNTNPSKLSLFGTLQTFYKRTRRKYVSKIKRLELLALKSLHETHTHPHTPNTPLNV